MPSPKLVPLILSDEERRALEGWARRRKTEQALALRSRIVLACALGDSNTEVARRLGVDRNTVSTWRARFVRDRLDGLVDEPRPGRPRTLTGTQVEQVVATTLETTPVGAAHWSTRSLAAQLGLNQTAVSRIWRAFGLRPRRTDGFRISEDPLFADTVRDVVGLYLDASANAVALCVGETSQIRELEGIGPVPPGVPRSFDYVRHGTAGLFAALEAAAGEVVGAAGRRHRSQEFLAFLDTVDEQVPADLAVHVVLDNPAVHKTDATRTWLVEHLRFHLHFAPTGSSWLGLVERFFAETTAKLLRRGVHHPVTALENDILRWVERRDADPGPHVWTRAADQTLESLAAYCTPINDSRR